MQIADNKFNQARKILVQAGSRNADETDLAYTHGAGVSEDYGVRLLQEASDEFSNNDPGQMTQVHREAIHLAADVMGVTRW